MLQGDEGESWTRDLAILVAVKAANIAYAPETQQHRQLLEVGEVEIKIEEKGVKDAKSLRNKILIGRGNKAGNREDPALPPWRRPCWNCK